jgi:hypothetical protein
MNALTPITEASPWPAARLEAAEARIAVLELSAKRPRAEVKTVVATLVGFAVGSCLTEAALAVVTLIHRVAG